MSGLQQAELRHTRQAPPLCRLAAALLLLLLLLLLCRRLASLCLLRLLARRLLLSQQLGCHALQGVIHIIAHLGGGGGGGMGRGMVSGETKCRGGMTAAEPSLLTQRKQQPVRLARIMLSLAS